MGVTEKIIVIQTAFLGDLILTFPLLRWLKKTYPKAEVTLVCRKGLASLFKNYLVVEKIFEVDKKNKNYSMITSQIKDDFDLLLCPHPSFSTALMSKRIKATKKIGFKKWWNFWAYDLRPQKNLKWPEPVRLLQLLSSENDDLNKNLLQFEDSYLGEILSDGQLTDVPVWADFFENESPPPKFFNRAAIFPGSIWKTKQWTEDGFRELVKALCQRGFEVHLLGSESERDLCQRIANSDQCVNWAGRLNLPESLEILKKCDFAVTNDSGGQHMASLVQIPVVSIFGPTVLQLGFRPWNSSSLVVQDLTLGCRPCGAHGHQECPLKHHKCMKNIKMHEVLTACLSLRENREVDHSI